MLSVVPGIRLRSAKLVMEGTADPSGEQPRFAAARGTHNITKPHREAGFMIDVIRKAEQLRCKAETFVQFCCSLYSAAGMGSGFAVVWVLISESCRSHLIPIRLLW